MLQLVINNKKKGSCSIISKSHEKSLIIIDNLSATPRNWNHACTVNVAVLLVGLSSLKYFQVPDISVDTGLRCTAGNPFFLCHIDFCTTRLYFSTWVWDSCVAVCFGTSLIITGDPLNLLLATSSGQNFKLVFYDQRIFLSLFFSWGLLTIRKIQNITSWRWRVCS